MKLQPGTVIPGAEPIFVPDRESEPSEKYLMRQIGRLEDALSRISQFVDNYVRRVDEQAGSRSFSETVTSLDVIPDFETGEIIESIIITGPPGAVQVTLGSRHWPLVIPASGILVIAPISIKLDQRDPRNLTPNTPGGPYAMELCGRIDKQ